MPWTLSVLRLLVFSFFLSLEVPSNTSGDPLFSFFFVYSKQLETSLCHEQHPGLFLYG